jgi:hypothetical protein
MPTQPTSELAASPSLGRVPEPQDTRRRDAVTSTAAGTDRSTPPAARREPPGPLLVAVLGVIRSGKRVLPSPPKQR